MTSLLYLEIKTQKLKYKKRHILRLFLLVVSFTSIFSQSSIPLYQENYLLLPNKNLRFIQINQSQLGFSSSSSNQYLKVNIKLQISEGNGSYVDSPLKTANLLVKYWKNGVNTQASQVLNYSYQKISFTKQFPQATDPYDKGIVDIEALYNYENTHNFICPFGKQTSDLLFVFAIYRFSNQQFTDLFQMSTFLDEIKISVTVFKAEVSELNCPFCSNQTFCSARSCQCYLQSYADCRVKKKNLKNKEWNSGKLKQVGKLRKGNINYFQIQPQLAIKIGNQLKIKVFMSLSDSNTTRNSIIMEKQVFVMFNIQNRTSPYKSIPNIYNYDVINSPSLVSEIINVKPANSQLFSQYHQVNQHKSIESKVNSLHLSQIIQIKEGQFISMAIYYLEDQNSMIDQIQHSIDINFIVNQSQFASQISVPFVIGMIAVGLFSLVSIICLFHILVTKKFSIFSIFSMNQSSNRTSIYTDYRQHKFHRSQKELNLPQVSFNLMSELIFKPMNYLSIIIGKNTKNSKLFISSKYVNINKQICSICLQEFMANSKVKYTYCGHVLDSKCLDSWLQKEMSCPICRQSFQPQDVSEYQDKIQGQILQKQIYLSILNQQIGIIKKAFSHYKQQDKKQPNHNSNFRYKATEESLADKNNVAFQGIQNNTQYVLSSILHQQSKQDFTNQQQKSPVEQKMMRVLAESNQFFDDFNTQQFSNLRLILQNNSCASFKKLIKIFKFYRCIYFYHQINKNFQTEQSLDQSAYYFEDKSVSNAKISIKHQRSLSQLKQYQNETPKIAHKTQQEVTISNLIYCQQDQDAEQKDITSQNKLLQEIATKIMQKRTSIRPSFALNFKVNDNPIHQQQKFNQDQSFNVSGQFSSQSLQNQRCQDRHPSDTTSNKTLKVKRLTMRDQMDRIQEELCQQQKKQQLQKQRSEAPQQNQSKQPKIPIIGPQKWTAGLELQTQKYQPKVQNGSKSQSSLFLSQRKHQHSRAKELIPQSNSADLPSNSIKYKSNTKQGPNVIRVRRKIDFQNL